MSGLGYQFECLLIFTLIQMFGFHCKIEIHFSSKCLVFVISLKSFVLNFGFLSSQSDPIDGLSLKDIFQQTEIQQKLLRL